MPPLEIHRVLLYHYRRLVGATSGPTSVRTTGKTLCLAPMRQAKREVAGEGILGPSTCVQAARQPGFPRQLGHVGDRSEANSGRTHDMGCCEGDVSLISEARSSSWRSSPPVSRPGSNTVRSPRDARCCPCRPSLFGVVLLLDVPHLPGCEPEPPAHHRSAD